MPKLSVRDLFAVVTIVALALGWSVDRSRLARDRNKFEFELDVRRVQAETLNEVLERLGYKVEFWGGADGNGDTSAAIIPLDENAPKLRNPYASPPVNRTPETSDIDPFASNGDEPSLSK